MPNRALGRRSPKNAPALRLADILTGVVPEHPVAADHFSEVTDWGLYRNDQFGDCGPTSVANLRKLISKYLADNEQSPSQDDVFDLYRRSGNPDFDPATGAGDNGVDMQTMLEEVHKNGIGGKKCLGFAKADQSNLDEVRAAIAIFGAVLYGVDLESAQQAQTDAGGPWDYKRSSEWGGHAVLAGRYTSAKTGTDVSVITWGEVIGTTDAFAQRQLEEAWVVIWPEHLGTKEFQEGVDQAALAAAYETLTGRQFPVAPTPSPVPVPTPQPPSPTPDVAPADLKLAKRAHRFVKNPWRYSRSQMTDALQDWLTERGL